MNTDNSNSSVLDDSFIPYPETAIAIIGMAGHLPDCDGVDEFWQALKNGYCPLKSFSDDELQVNADVDLKDPRLVKKGYVIDDMADFDAAFFGFSEAEALLTDPQQRLFLQVAWQALERAGYATGKVEVPVSVFACANFNTYGIRFAEAMQAVDLHEFLQIVVGNDKEYMASRLSYLLNLTGPALNIQSACSSSLVAISQACQSLQCYQSDIALVGAAALKAWQRSPYLAQEGGASSRDAHCRAFDANASGIIEGFGAGAVVLKRYQDAIADRDHIHAVITGHAINNDGNRKVGYSAPSTEAQIQVLQEALEMSGIHGEKIRFVEAHGTGTPLGDPIEVSALTEVYGNNNEEVLLGSVKTNIGHLDSAAGVCGLIKAAKVMQTGEVPPNLHFVKANPNISFEELPFSVNTKLQQLDATSPYVGTVSSFGLGGTNAHLVLTQPPEYCQQPEQVRAQLLPLSARSDSALKAATTRLEMYLGQSEEKHLANVAYTLQCGRKTFIKRSFVVASELDELSHQLKQNNLPIFTEFDRQQVIFLCPGVGAQQVNMGRELYQQEPVFAETLRQCETELQRLAPEEMPLLKVIYPASDDADAEARMSQPLPAMTTTFAITVATARLLQSWGLQPDVLAGHSLGQYAAAYLAGVFKLEDALFLILERARCMQATPDGAMLAVRTSEEKLLPLLNEELSLGAVNTKKLCLVSGTREVIDAFEKTLRQQRIPNAKLPASKAGHSHLLDPVLPRFQASLNRINFQPAKIPMLCNLTGRWLDESNMNESNMNADYWLRHLRHTVRFADMVDTLAENSGNIFYELGQGSSLLNMLQQHRQDLDKQRCITTLGNGTDANRATLLQALGTGWTQGAEVRWQRDCSDANAGFIPLSTYAFEKQRYWIDENTKSRFSNKSASRLEPMHEGSVEQADKQQNKQPDEQSNSESSLSWVSVPRWLPKPLNALAKHALSAKCIWLVSDNGRFDDLKQTWSQAGATVIHLTSDNADWRKQLSQLLLEHGQPDLLIYAHNLVQAEQAQPKEVWHKHVENILDEHCFNLLKLIQELVNSSELTATPILLLGSHSVSVAGESHVSPLRASVQAIPLAINRECKQLGCRYVDIDIQLTTEQQIRLIEKEVSQLLQLENAVEELKCSEPIYAWRGRCRWQRSFEKHPLDKVQQTDLSSDLPLRQGGNYLILGGFGGIGYTLAQALVEQCNANIVLASRAVPPPESQWGKVVAEQGVDSPVAARIKLWRSLQKNGNRVLALPVDLADEQSVNELWLTAEKELGALHGVIHAAGETGGGLLTLQDKDGCKANLDAKLRGLANLHTKLKQSQLDFLLLSSSLSTFLGASGQLDNLLGNFALDALAYQSELNIPVISVNWDYWLDVGMINELDAQHYAMTGEHLNEGISPQAGQALLQPILNSGCSQLLISARDLSTRYQAALADNLSGLEDFANLSVADTEALKARPEIASSYAKAETPLQQLLIELWQRHLGIETIGINDGYIALGGNSLLALPLMSELRELLAQELPLKLLFEAETIAGLAKQLESNPQWVTSVDNLLAIQQEIEQLSDSDIVDLLEEETEESPA